MDEQVVSLGFGKENFQRTGMSLGAFHLEAPWKTELPSKNLKRQGHMQAFPASLHPDINGRMYIDTVRAPEGTLFLLKASHKQIIREGRPPTLRDGALILRTRSTGSLITVHAYLAQAVEASLTGKFLAFQGRADVLSDDEIVDWGLRPTANFCEAFFDPSEIDQCFDVTVVAPGIAAPKMETVKIGDKVIAVPARAARRVVRRR